MKHVKRLYLIRHAKSSWKDPDLDDFDRPLNKRGKADAPLMGRRLKEQGVKPDLIISSPAKRALKTSEIFANKLNYSSNKIITDESLYLEGRDSYLKVVQKIDDRHDVVILFGHNPDITAFGEDLTGKEIGNIPTCGVLCVGIASSWKQVVSGSGKFVFFDYPKKL